MTIIEPHRAKSTPASSGGSFAEHGRSVPEGDLPAAPLLTPQEAADAIDMQNFPTPQANDLGRVLNVIDAVDDGARNGGDIAEYFDVDPSEGGFYAAAAGTLGLIKRDHNGEFRVTDLGARVQAMDLNDRSSAIQQIAASYPGVQAYRLGGEAGATEFLSQYELSDTTIARRVSTMEAWARTVDDSHAYLTADVIVSVQPTQKRITQQDCVSCGNVLPLSGECDFC